jgi:raffinose/stachyose/melibiose transport system substrate-binding protein
MKTKKLLAMGLALATASAMLAGCGSSSSSSESQSAAATEAAPEAATETAAETATETAADSATEAAATEAGAYETEDFSGVTIEMLNTKSEIEDQIEKAAATWGAETGATLNVYTIGSNSPSTEISSRYAAGNAPALIMGDIQDIVTCVKAGYARDLSDQTWVANGGDTYGYKTSDGLYSFPFCIEARGLMYNKTAVEDTLGRDWDPSEVKTMDDLKALFDELVDAGMETPVALNMEDWSLAGHYLTLVYEQQGTDLNSSENFIRALADGSEKIENNARFNSLFDTFDLLMEYNSNRDDPLAADYSMNAADLAEGEVAFWFNGNWAWAETSEYYVDGTELGIMPVPQNDTDNNATDWLAGSASKHVMVDTVCNDDKQQAAALNFLSWLANTDEGNDVIVNQCSLVPAFSNIKEEATNGFAQSVKDYASEGKLFPGVIDYPGDHWSTLGASMQKYLGGEIDRAELAKEIDDYWTAQKLDPWEN